MTRISSQKVCHDGTLHIRRETNTAFTSDFIGSFVIKADDYLGQKLVEETFTLIPRKKSDGPAGKIRMQIIHAKVRWSMEVIS